MTVGEKIYEYIDEKGIKQVFLAEASGLGQQKLNRILKGKQEITVADYEVICGVLSVGVDFFSRPRLLKRG